MAITSSISTTHQAYDASINQRERCRSAIAGQDVIKLGGQKYLPPVNVEQDTDNSDYAIYLENAEWYNAVGLTYAAFLGMIFRKNPQVGDFTADSINEDSILNNVNLEGDDIFTFIRDMTIEELKVGRVGVLVDYPATDELGELTISEAARNGVRPFAKIYNAEAIINWKYRTIRGVKKLISVVLRERIEKPSTSEGDNLFSHDLENQYRALVIIDGVYSQIIYNDALEEVDRVNITFNGKPLTEIPFTVINPTSIGMEVEKPPLLDMTDTNISHYRASAALGANIHMFARITPIFKVPAEHFDQFLSQDMEFGSTKSIVIPTSSEGADSDAYFLEPKSDFTPIVNQQIRLEERMASQGARMLSTPKAGVESVDTVRLDMMGELSILSSIAKNLSEGITQIVSQLLGKETPVVLNSDFLTMPIDAGMITALLMSLQAGRLSEAQFIDSLVRGEAIKEEAKIITDTAFTSSPDTEALGVPAADGELKGREDNVKKKEPLSNPNGLEKN